MVYRLISKILWLRLLWLTSLNFILSWCLIRIVIFLNRGGVGWGGWGGWCTRNGNCTYVFRTQSNIYFSQKSSIIYVRPGSKYTPEAFGMARAFHERQKSFRKKLLSLFLFDLSFTLIQETLLNFLVRIEDYVFVEDVSCVDM